MSVNALLAQAQTSTTDHTKAPETFVRERPPAGPTPARFIGYVETGKRPGEYNGKPKTPVVNCILFFELNGKKHQREVEVDGVKKIFTNRAMVRLAVKTADRASFGKLFRAMRNGRDNITNMAQMLGEGFLVTVVHNTVGEGDKAKTYVNLKDDNGWRVGPPIFQDPLSGDVTHIPVPEATQDLMLLLWDNPTKEQWDSIFIDGTHTRKDKEGNEVEVSNNWLQKDIVQNAIDFEGSPLADVLAGLGELNFDNTADPDEDDSAPETKQEDDPLAGATESAEKPESGPSEAEIAAAAKAKLVERAAQKAAAEKAAAEKPKEEPKEEPKAEGGDKSADDILAALGL